MMFSTNKSIISAFALLFDHKYAAQKGCWYCSKQRLIATECMFIWWYPPLHLQLLVSFSDFSVGFCINEEKGYLLPTLAQKTKRRQSCFSELELVTDNLFLHLCLYLIAHDWYCVHHEPEIVSSTRATVYHCCYYYNSASEIILCTAELGLML